MGRPRKEATVLAKSEPEETIVEKAETKTAGTESTSVKIETKAQEEKKPLIEVIHTPSVKEMNKAKLQKFIDEETKTVKGTFRMYETPGGSSRIQIRKYPGIPMFDKTMKDGEKYEIPLYAARHLNGVDATATAIGGKIGTCSYPVHGFKYNPLEALPSPAPGSEMGIPVPISGITKRVRRFGFESLEFDAL